MQAGGGAGRTGRGRPASGVTTELPSYPCSLPMPGIEVIWGDSKDRWSGSDLSSHCFLSVQP